MRTKLLVKSIVYCEQAAIVLCDGNCRKAWGINSRPKNQLSADEDDYEYLADGELGDAPVNPGTYEGGDAKPTNYSDPARQNRWCVRECERCAMTAPGSSEIELRNFTNRRPNIPGKVR